jgi:hypothetical protein
VVFDHERVLAQYPLIGKIGRRSLTLATLTAPCGLDRAPKRDGFIRHRALVYCFVIHFSQ